MDPNNYEKALQLLQEHRQPKKKLTSETYLYGGVLQVTDGSSGFRTWWRKEDKNPPDVIFVEMYETRIIEYWPDGSYVLRGRYSRTTQDRFRRFTPFRPYTHMKYGFLRTISGARGYTSEMKVDAEGRLLDPADEWLNKVDAEKYFADAMRYTNKMVRSALHGKLLHWSMPEETMATRTSQILVDHVLQNKRCGYIIDLCINLSPMWQRREVAEVREAMIPKVYRGHFLKPRRGTRAELERYVSQLTCQKKFTFKHPMEKYDGVFRILRGRLAEAVNLETW
jgi:hypothetical protein